MASVTRLDETLQITLRLPKAVAEHLREQVASGLYPSESEYIESLLFSETVFPPIDQDQLTEWINTEGVRRLRVMEADPSRALTADEVFDFLDEDVNEDEAS